MVAPAAAIPCRRWQKGVWLSQVRVLNGREIDPLHKP
jgi:hypothetical protein